MDTHPLRQFQDLAGEAGASAFDAEALQAESRPRWARGRLTAVPCSLVRRGQTFEAAMSLQRYESAFPANSSGRRRGR